MASGAPSPRAVHGVAYDLRLVRHIDEGYVMVPAPRPFRLPFPFDVGLGLSAAELRWEREAGTWRVDTLRVAPLLDVAKHGAVFYRLAFGPELAHAVAGGREAPARNLLLPFTGGVLDGRFESSDGLWIGTLIARAGVELEIDGPSRFAAMGTLELERTLIAVNDNPLAVFARGAFEKRERWTLEAHLGARMVFPY